MTLSALRSMREWLTRMDRRERANDIGEALLAALRGWQAQVWTAMPGVVQSFDPVKMTCIAQLAIQMLQRFPDGGEAWVDVSPLVDVPVVFVGGGGFTLTYPIAAGDEALIIFSSRCIDTWWQSGGIHNIQAERRLHDLSDGFAIIGPRSQPRVLGEVSATTAQLRSDDGATFIEVGPGTINLKAATIKIEATASLEMKCNHGVVWIPDHIDTYQNGIASTAHDPPAP